mmetsp:Transcript_63/g.82  ORF Transcript_63/g.82 Transcript_63/m.82 type:complete len:97 (+) Transcript_63:174-464(+)|eukprot:CAMPEP_0194368940 /NCGR_PEP_ID=MMETSP0174-20130528/17176_1 /TAXON_ID=216777 /ORGANISM="Proboscia alata, Strain PI-D3" /LENGTH=96 /DNA_ID=CAMNT_0039145561 /DNA_START=155 /DNA_END=445 /DNA_ORIENTATION=-
MLLNKTNSLMKKQNTNSTSQRTNAVGMSDIVKAQEQKQKSHVMRRSASSVSVMQKPVLAKVASEGDANYLLKRPPATTTIATTDRDRPRSNYFQRL